MGLKSIFVLAMLGVLGLLISILWFLPASLAWQQLSSSLVYPKDLAVATPRGSVREGSTWLRFRGFPPSQLSWQAGWPRMTEGEPTIDYDLRLQGPDHLLTGNLTLTLSNQNLKVNAIQGYLGSNDINRLAVPFGHQFSGEFTLREGAFKIQNSCLTSLTGTLLWTGGPIVFSTPRETARYDLPQLSADLSDQDCGIRVDVKTVNSDSARLVLSAEGWFLAELAPEFLQALGVKGAAQLKGPLLFEEKIL